MSIVIFILAFFTIILIHEFGHFGAAKLFKMNAYQFNLGMGPILWKKQHKETQFALRALPIGGSCVLGEDDAEYSDDPNDFRNKPVWQRIIVIAGGAFLNLVLGLILCVVIYIVEPIPSTTVSVFDDNAVSNTGVSGLQVGDQIIKVNGMHIVSASEIFYKMDNSLTKKGITEDAEGEFAVYEFVVIRKDEKIMLPQVKFAAHPNERGGMNYVRDFWISPVDKNFINVLAYSARYAVGMSRIVWLSLMDIIGGTYGLNEISGPVGIVGVASEVTAQAKNFGEVIMSIISISALITINLGIVNLLPIPALDGARIIFLTAEGIRRKPINPTAEGMIHFAGFALLMLLILIVTFNDVRKLIIGG
ncbi:MAG: site-2 protease family protein [Oscillospiraceae bacterium]|nr:site-2 protease family protein [Oscillospiraceae bacterium]